MLWKEWLAPGLLVATATAIISWQLSEIDKRFGSVDSQYADVGRRLTDLDAKLDRRADASIGAIKDLNGRIDGVLQQQTTFAAELGRSNSDIAYIKAKLDRVAEKLQVTELDKPVPSPREISRAVALTEEQRRVIREAAQHARQQAKSIDFAEVGALVPADSSLIRFPSRSNEKLNDYVFGLSSNGNIVIVDPVTRRIISVQ